MRNGDSTQYLKLDRYTQLYLLHEYLKLHGEGSDVSRIAKERIKDLKPMKVIMYDLNISRGRSGYLFAKFSRVAMQLYRSKLAKEHTVESNVSLQTATTNT